MYAAALEASQSKCIASMMCDLGFDVMIGATATKHMVHRQGIGRIPHIDFAHLWSQYGVGSNRMVVSCVSSEQIVAGLRTTALSRAVIARRAKPPSDTLVYPAVSGEKKNMN